MTAALSATDSTTRWQAMRQALNGAAIPAGGTPTAVALNQVLDYFQNGPGSVMVGDPAQTQNICQYDSSQCLDQADAIKAVSDLNSKGIRTVVLGIPGTEYTQYQTVLNQMGAAGGLPNPDANYDYFPVSATSGLAGLRATLQKITTSPIQSCELELSSQPPDTHLLNVVIDGTTVAQSGSDGWSLDTTTAPPTVLLKGATCQRMQTQGAQSVDITYGCPTVTVN